MGVLQGAIRKRYMTYPLDRSLTHAAYQHILSTLHPVVTSCPFYKTSSIFNNHPLNTFISIPVLVHVPPTTCLPTHLCITDINVCIACATWRERKLLSLRRFWCSLLSQPSTGFVGNPPPPHSCDLQAIPTNLNQINLRITAS